jgi:uncharacterized protein
MYTVAHLSVAPVKSMRLLHVDEVRLERFGVPENRRFFVADPDGRLVTAAKCGVLLAVVPRYDPGTESLALEFPDGSRAEADATKVGEPIESSFYGRPVAAHVLEGPWSAALSEYAGRPLSLARVDRPGDGNDEAPVSIASTASAEELARRSGRPEALDARRFRMLVEVFGCRPHEEDTWNGSRVRIGEAVVRVVSPVARCVITTKDPSTGRKDFDTLKAIPAYRGKEQGQRVLFGVYAKVVEPGAIHVGDPVDPLPVGGIGF